MLWATLVEKIENFWLLNNWKTIWWKLRTSKGEDGIYLWRFQIHKSFWQAFNRSQKKCYSAKITENSSPTRYIEKSILKQEKNVILLYNFWVVILYQEVSTKFVKGSLATLELDLLYLLSLTGQTMNFALEKRKLEIKNLEA